ncbi:MAG: hypothetical protein Q9M34_01820, partial [Sulfurimonas sp.]|nr:hypothetical protein [Sulfurimonas sp.]
MIINVGFRSVTRKLQNGNAVVFVILDCNKECETDLKSVSLSYLLSSIRFMNNLNISSTCTTIFSSS